MNGDSKTIVRSARTLCQGALESMRGDLGALDRAIEDTKATTEDLARAAHLSMFEAPFNGTAAVRSALETRLQVLLMREHVEAQRSMGQALTWMTATLVALTVALLVFTVLLVKFAHAA